MLSPSEATYNQKFLFLKNTSYLMKYDRNVMRRSERDAASCVSNGLPCLSSAFLEIFNVRRQSTRYSAQHYSTIFGLQICNTYHRHRQGEHRKIEFLTIFEKLLLKIEPSEITSFFYNNIFHFGGGGGTFLMIFVQTREKLRHGLLNLLKNKLK